MFKIEERIALEERLNTLEALELPSEETRKEMVSIREEIEISYQGPGGIE